MNGDTLMKLVTINH